MRLYLVQHGEAKSKEEDPDRGLTDKGIRDVEKVAVALKSLSLRIDSLWHSGKTRVRHTAEILHPSIASSCELIERDGLSPNDPVGDMKQVIEEGGADIMIVGHLPFLNRLSALLVIADENSDVVIFQNGGILCLEYREIDNWSIAWMIVPEVLE